MILDAIKVSLKQKRGSLPVKATVAKKENRGEYQKMESWKKYAIIITVVVIVAVPLTLLAIDYHGWGKVTGLVVVFAGIPGVRMTTTWLVSRITAGCWDD